MTKVDLYHNERRYQNWKELATKTNYIEPDLTSSNSKVFLRFIFDMENGTNVSLLSKKGSRSFVRLNALRTRLRHLFILFQERKVNDITKVKEEQVTSLFNDMRQAKIKSNKGEKYKSISDYVEVFKSFYHWFIKVSKKKGIEIKDLTSEVDSRKEEKPKWVFLDETQMPLLLNKCDSKYKPLLSYLYCSGSRVTEAFSLLVQDISEEKGVVYANIRQETSKTFGRKFKLLMCGKDLLEYIKRSELKPEDRLFNVSPEYVNRYIGRLAQELFGDGISKGGSRYSELSMYDFRHCSCCYWIQRYKNNMGLMYKFGWKTEKYILYYSEFLGMRDLISSEDLYIDVTKTELEKQLEEQRKEFAKAEGEKKILQGKVGDMEIQMSGVLKSLHELRKDTAKLRR